MTAPRLVIFLHGVGARGADLAPLGQHWAAALPQTAFAAPDGPLPFDQGGQGRQWFSIAGVTEANRPARIAAARAGFDAVLAQTMAAHGLQDAPERVALVGFSQGTIMALDALATGRWPVAAVVGFSGRLASAEPLQPAPGGKALLIHGLADQMIPARESESAAARLTALGVATRLHLQPGLGHSISAEGAALAADFLAQALPG